MRESYKTRSPGGDKFMIATALMRGDVRLQRLQRAQKLSYNDSCGCSMSKKDCNFVELHGGNKDKAYSSEELS